MRERDEDNKREREIDGQKTGSERWGQRRRGRAKGRGRERQRLTNKARKAESM